MSCDKVDSQYKTLFVKIGVVVALTGFVASAAACPIPVFQYALENWAVDPYEVSIYHDEAFCDDSKAALEKLKAAEAGENACSNLTLRVHDLSDNEDVQRPADANLLPYMEVRYPVYVRSREPVWAGSLTPEAVESLLHSPVREKLAEYLLDRKTAVWILLEGDERAENNAAFRILQAELDRLEKTLVLPDTAEWEDQTVEIYNTVAFEVLRLRRDDPAEQVLVQMLLRSERDLIQLGEVPMAFPIYGRGLILYALVDKGINSWTIGDAGAFLAGPCSCQIKAGNPGLDVLMSVDWEANVDPLAAQTPPAPVGTGGFIRRLQEAEDELDDDD